MTVTILLWMLATVLILSGLVGLLVPVLPGPLLLFLGFLLAAWAEAFVYVGAGTLVTLGLMAALMYLIDLAATVFGAKRFGASRQAAIGAVLGALVGIFFGLAGVLLGPFIGAVVGELQARTGLRAAGRAGLGATIGLAIGAAVKIALGLSMVGIFLMVRFL